MRQPSITMDPNWTDQYRPSNIDYASDQPDSHLIHRARPAGVARRWRDALRPEEAGRGFGRLLLVRAARAALLRARATRARRAAEGGARGDRPAPAALPAHESRPGGAR